MLYDELTEKIMLYYIIFENYECDVTEEDFIDSKNKLIMKSIIKLKKENKLINIVNIQSCFNQKQKEIIQYITSLSEYAYGTESDLIYCKLIEYTKKRKLLDILKDGIKNINENENLESDIINDITKLGQRTLTEKYDFKTQILLSVGDIEDSYNLRNDYSLYTGVTELDSKTLGLHKQELTIIGARPGVRQDNICIANCRTHCKKRAKCSYI